MNGTQIISLMGPIGLMRLIGRERMMRVCGGWGIVDIITGCAGDVHPVKYSIRSNDAGYLSSRGAGYLLTWNLFHPSVR